MEYFLFRWNFLLLMLFSIIFSSILSSIHLLVPIMYICTHTFRSPIRNRIQNAICLCVQQSNRLFFRIHLFLVHLVFLFCFVHFILFYFIFLWVRLFVHQFNSFIYVCMCTCLEQLLLLLLMCHRLHGSIHWCYVLSSQRLTILYGMSQYLLIYTWIFLFSLSMAFHFILINSFLLS